MELYVANLAYEMTDAELSEAFAGFGEIQKAAIAKDRTTGRSRGFGFVGFVRDDAGRAAAAAMDGRTLAGRPIRVSEVRQRPGDPRPPLGRHDSEVGPLYSSLGVTRSPAATRPPVAKPASEEADDEGSLGSGTEPGETEHGAAGEEEEDAPKRARRIARLQHDKHDKSRKGGRQRFDDGDRHRRMRGPDQEQEWPRHRCDEDDSVDPEDEENQPQ